MAEPTKELVRDDVKADEAKRLDAVIRESGLKKGEVVQRARFGSPSYLTQLLNGSRPINLAAACQLANALHVRIDAFSPRIADMIRDAARLIQDQPAQAGASLVAEESRPAYDADVIWPFASVTPREFSLISMHGREQLEMLARGMAIEAAGTKQTAA